MNASLLEKSELPALQEALRRRICGVCIDRNVDGTCSYLNRNECSLFRRFPQIAEAISRVHSDKIDDYVTAIRDRVCVGCPEQDAEGLCEQREQIRCVLDRYLILIVDAIEEVRGVALKPGALLQRP